MMMTMMIPKHCLSSNPALLLLPNHAKLLLQPLSAVDELLPRRLLHRPLLVGQLHAELLPELLLCATVASRTPTQAGLWDAVGRETGGDEEGADLLRQIREVWQRWPDLHEADRFPGVTGSSPG